MLTHTDIWIGIDTLAKQMNTTPSGLAKIAGLDATIFNISKRTTPQGNEQWVNSRSLARVLNATGTSFVEFAKLCTPQSPYINPIHGIALSELPPYKYDIKNLTTHIHDTEISDSCFMVIVDTHALKPDFAKGDQIIATITANIRPNDMVITYVREGNKNKMYTGKVQQNGIYHLVLRSGRKNIQLPQPHIVWQARVLWKSLTLL